MVADLNINIQQKFGLETFQIFGSKTRPTKLGQGHHWKSYKDFVLELTKITTILPQLPKTAI